MISTEHIQASLKSLCEFWNYVLNEKRSAEYINALNEHKQLTDADLTAACKNLKYAATDKTHFPSVEKLIDTAFNFYDQRLRLEAEKRKFQSQTPIFGELPQKEPPELSFVDRLFGRSIAKMMKTIPPPCPNETFERICRETANELMAEGKLPEGRGLDSGRDTPRYKIARKVAREIFQKSEVYDPFAEE